MKNIKNNLILQIVIIIFLGVFVALTFPVFATKLSFLGALFTTLLKSVAPILVFVLVIDAIAKYQTGSRNKIKLILAVYLLSTFLAAVVATVAGFIFPLDLVLNLNQAPNLSPPGDFVEVIKNLLLSAVDNPIRALTNANFIGILVWGIAIGIAFRQASETTRLTMSDFSVCLSMIIKIVIRFAPIGIFGIITDQVAHLGLSIFKTYGYLLLVLLGVMLFTALVVNSIIVFSITRKNPFPLVFLCLKESGITAFFTRSSAANIPVNMQLAEKLKLDPAVYSLSIPLGATINMAGAAITITILTLAATYTLGISVTFGTALLLCFIASLCACGVSGVAGGSLLLLPISCGLFGIPVEISMMVVSVGLIIGVLQDSMETALNSSSDILFTAAVCQSK